MVEARRSKRMKLPEERAIQFSEAGDPHEKRNLGRRVDLLAGFCICSYGPTGTGGGKHRAEGRRQSRAGAGVAVYVGGLLELSAGG